MTGDEVGTFSTASTFGKSNGTKVTLDGVEPLGSSTDVFRNVAPGDTPFSTGQSVDIYAWPDSDPNAQPIFFSLNPQHDQFLGRASSGDHQIITSLTNIVFDVNGLSAGQVQYGPGLNPPRDRQLSFDVFSPDPPTFPCFAAGTLIETDTGPLAFEALRVGDLVRTLDNGLQPVRWLGQREVPGFGQMAPIEIEAGALGNWRRLVVSPQQRMLVGDWRTDMYFGDAQGIRPVSAL